MILFLQWAWNQFTLTRNSAKRHAKCRRAALVEIKDLLKKHVTECLKAQQKVCESLHEMKDILRAILLRLCKDFVSGIDW